VIDVDLIGDDGHAAERGLTRRIVVVDCRLELDRRDRAGLLDVVEVHREAHARNGFQDRAQGEVPRLLGLQVRVADRGFTHAVGRDVGVRAGTRSVKVLVDEAVRQGALRDGDIARGRQRARFREARDTETARVGAAQRQLLYRLELHAAFGEKLL
jgi:hypothetical protein